MKYNNRVQNVIDNHCRNNYNKSKKNNMAIADTGCTSHYMGYSTTYRDQTPAGYNNINVEIPDMNVMQSTHIAKLPLQNISEAARKCHLFKEMKSKTLISIGQLCDDGMTALFTKESLKISKDNKCIIEGNRDKKNGMWYIDLKQHKKIHVMDNECSEIVKKFLCDNDATLQLVPPNMHSTNEAEKDIVTFKNHFISGLATVHPNFPIHLWCRLIPLATTTLNLMRPSRINPKLSAYEILNGTFDYNRNPIATPGTKVVVHETPTNRRTWDPHGVDGWYIGMAPNHYRGHKVDIPKTRAERITNSVKFFPHKAQLPQNNIREETLEAARALIDTLNKNAKDDPVASDKNKTATALKQLADIFINRATDDINNSATFPRVKEEQKKNTHECYNTGVTTRTTPKTAKRKPERAK